MSRNGKHVNTSTRPKGDLNSKIAASVALFAICVSVIGTWLAFIMQSYSPNSDENRTDELIEQLLRQNTPQNQPPLDMTPTILDENGNPVDIEIINPDDLSEDHKDSPASGTEPETPINPPSDSPAEPQE